MLGLIARIVSAACAAAGSIKTGEANMDPQIEQHMKDCAELRDDPNKSAKTRRVARISIEICHGVIDLKNENERLYRQIEELRQKLKGIPEAS